MGESLEHLRSYIGRSETATDVVTASMLVKFAATLGQPDPPLAPGSPIPPGWHGGLFPPAHRPSEMRADGQAAGGGIVPPIPLPRRRIGGTRTTFLESLRVGDEVTRTIEIADLRVDEGPTGAMVAVVERSSLSTRNGLCVVEEREIRALDEARAAAQPTAVPSVPEAAMWRQVLEPTTPLLFRFSALRFNSHRIHYDREYVTGVEGLPGLVVQSSLLAQLLLEMCRREVPAARVASFEVEVVRSVYDVGPATLLGRPSADGTAAALWVLDSEQRLATRASVAFTPGADGG